MNSALSILLLPPHFIFSTGHHREIRHVIISKDVLFIILDSWWVHHYSHTSSHSVRWEIFGKFRSHGSGVSMGSSHFSPNHSQVGLFGFIGDWRLVLGLKNNEVDVYKIDILKYIFFNYFTHPVNVCALLANIPFSVSFTLASFDLQKSCVFMLISKTTLEAGEHGLCI